MDRPGNFGWQWYLQDSLPLSIWPHWMLNTTNCWQVLYCLQNALGHKLLNKRVKSNCGSFEGKFLRSVFDICFDFRRAPREGTGELVWEYLVSYSLYWQRILSSKSALPYKTNSCYNLSPWDLQHQTIKLMGCHHSHLWTILFSHLKGNLELTRKKQSTTG